MVLLVWDKVGAIARLKKLFFHFSTVGDCLSARLVGTVIRILVFRVLQLAGGGVACSRLSGALSSCTDMQRVFQKFLDCIEGCRNAPEFRLAMAEAAAAFDLSCFAYLRMPRDQLASVALISNYPVRWTDHYLQQHYEKVDPVIAQAHKWDEPFEWGISATADGLSPAQEQFFDEAAEFGIRCGLTIPVQDGRGPVAAVTFASDAPRPEFLQIIEQNKLVLQLMALSLHFQVRRKLDDRPPDSMAGLTPREVDCIRWVAEGKTAWETAKILQISENTVIWHIENAKRKLGVRTKSQIARLLGRATQEGAKCS
jgi:DNA-binding CsgD family transcriptional regulator